MTDLPESPTAANAAAFNARTADPADYRAARDEMVAGTRRRATQPAAAQDGQATAPAAIGAELGNTSTSAATPAAATKPERVPALKMPAVEYAAALAKAVPGYRR